jgi:hypothetical protein
VGDRRFVLFCVAQAVGSEPSTNAEIRDVVVGDFIVANGGVCSLDATATIGGSVVVDGGCWTHSHPEERNVYDFSLWTYSHPGNMDALRANRR